MIKLDLSKAYDRVCWLYMRLIWIHTGFNLPIVNWIMGCVTYTSYDVLINESPLRFFKPSHGLRQGCPISPYLFLLVAKGFNE